MTLIYCEGFDCEGTDANLTRKNWVVSNTDVDPAAAAARTGANGLRLAAYNRSIYRDLGANEDVIVMGFAYRTANAPTIQARMCGFFDVTTAQVTVNLDNSLTPTVVGPGGLLGTSSLTLVVNTWYYVEFKATIADSGSWELRINGVNVTSGSGDTKATSNAYATRIYLGTVIGGTQANNSDYDDFYVLNNSGSSPTNDFLGDCKVETLFPNGNGNSSQFTGSDGNSTDNYLLVDEATPNDDTDYVEDSTAGHKDTYATGNLATTSGTVYGVQTSYLARKTDAGSRSMTSVARLSSTETDGATASIGDTYLYYTDMRETKPGGGAWSISDVNSAEFGVKLVA